ncbi:MAG: phosphomethylpyrimidine synthase ThiC, partial [Methylophilaceae bacterium]
MNATDKALKKNIDQFVNKDATLDEAALKPFPKSQKVYVEGSTPDIRVPFREISLSDTPSQFGAEKNPPVLVYDTSGPYTDPKYNINIQNGLPPLRTKWIEDRKDTELLNGPTSIFGQERKIDPELEKMRFNLLRNPRKAKPGKNVSQMHYAKKGIITEEMEFVAYRENIIIDKILEGNHEDLLKQHKSMSFGAKIPPKITPEFVRSQ